MKNLLLFLFTIWSFNSVHAKSINCAGTKGEIKIDDSMKHIVVTEQRAVMLTDLLLGGENVYVDYIIIPTGNGKITGDYILKLDSILPSEANATVAFIGGHIEKVKISGGSLSVNFNPFYDIGLRGGLTILKSGSYKVINLDESLGECLNF